MRCEVALADRHSILATAELPPGSKPTSTVVPGIRDLVRQLGWSLRDLDLVCVNIGPGSYTGLRVGLTCGKVLALAAGSGLAAVGSLDVVARNHFGVARVLEVAYDAARGQVFAARFELSEPEPRHADRMPPQRSSSSLPGSSNELEDLSLLDRESPQLGTRANWICVQPVRIVDANQWAAGLDPSALVTGPALVKYRNLLADHQRVADESDWWPHASQVIELGIRQFDAGLVPSYWELEPIYLRLSAAEEKTAPSRA